MKKYDKDLLFSFALGITVTLELLMSENTLGLTECVYIHSSYHDGQSFNKIKELCQLNSIKIIQNDKIFNVLQEKENCYVIGKFRKFNSILSLKENHVVLVNPSNMGNLGTIIRTSLGFGIKDIAIIKPAVDVFNPKVIRASMGALFNMRIMAFDDITEYLNLFKNRQKYTFMLNGSKSLKDVDIKEPYSLFFGNEATGLPKEYVSLGTNVLIKHSSQIDSLNLDNAVSIALYEFTKSKF